MSDYADIVRAGIRIHPDEPTDVMVTLELNALAALDALVAERDEQRSLSHEHYEAYVSEVAERQKVEVERDALRDELAEARRLLREVVKADQQDAQMGYPIPGDSCMGAFIGLVLMEYLDEQGLEGSALGVRASTILRVDAADAVTPVAPRAERITAAESRVAALEEALREIADAVEPKLSTMNYYFGPGSRTAVGRDSEKAWTRIKAAVVAARAALADKEGT